jgi:hypothetical protein
VYQAILIQPVVQEWLTFSQPMALVVFPIGIMLVLGAYIRLGIVGTYLGDHFGICNFFGLIISNEAKNYWISLFHCQ